MKANVEMSKIEEDKDLMLFLDDIREGLDFYIKEEFPLREMNYVSQVVLSKIQKAFSGVTCCGEKYGLVSSAAKDDYLSESELDVLSNLEERYSWQNIPPYWLYACEASLSFAGPEAFRFLIPAYMCAALQFNFSDGRVFEYHIGDSIGENSDIIQYKMQQVSLLNNEQKKSISYYLRHMYCRDHNINELNVNDTDNLHNTCGKSKGFMEITPWELKELSESHSNCTYSAYMNNLLSEYINWVRVMNQSA